jgi:putative tryptophan/tyrosine transport system substrate-binding protein
MRRRDVFLLVGCGVLASSGAQAQAPTRIGKIGYLHPRTIALDSPTLRVLKAAWESLGYAEPGSVLLRSAADNPTQLPKLAGELVELGVGVLIAVGPAAVKAASGLGVPVVGIDLESDPIRNGLAASFARPGGNVTGLFVDQPSVAGKMIDLLKEAVPTLERVAIMNTPSTTPHQVEAALGAARARGLNGVLVEKSPAVTYEEVFSGLGGNGGTGVVQLGSPGFILDSRSFAMAAEKSKLPTVAFLKVYVADGVLMSYGPNTDVYFSRAVVFADRILKGERPGELPIEQPAHFEFVINLKTAKALGLVLAPTLLARADEVIE